MNEASLRPRESVDGHRLSAAREGRRRGQIRTDGQNGALGHR
ncbi:MAG: hypothetical protein AAF645_11685 [Myxococcota bacterium]